MIHNMLRKRGGFAQILLLLIFLPLSIYSFVYSTTITQAVTVHDLDVQKALERAAKAAVMQVTKESQADGRPRINTANAQAIFQQQLAKNLGLDEITLSPLAGSQVTRPEYILVIYNVDTNYESSGAYWATKYVFFGGSLVSQSLSPTGHPTTFSVSETDIVIGSSEAIQVTMDRPGVVALVNTNMTRVTGSGAETITKWVSSKIISRTGI